MTKQEIQDSINELQKQLDKCPDVEPFTCKGGWHFDKFGNTYKGVGDNTAYIKSFNYWQTKEIAEKAYALQLRHRKMLSFVSQHQELGEGGYYVFKINREWKKISTVSYQPDLIVMTRETAFLMIEAIENGSLAIDYA